MSDHDAAAIELAEITSIAVDLRKKGRNYREIGREIGRTSGEAKTLVCEYLARIATEGRESAQEALELELERVDSLVAGLWDKATGPGGSNGDPVIVDRVTKLLEQRSKLLGLYAPQQHVLLAVEDGLERILEIARATIAPDQFDLLIAALQNENFGGSPAVALGLLTPRAGAQNPLIPVSDRD